MRFKVSPAVVGAEVLLADTQPHLLQHHAPITCQGALQPYVLVEAKGISCSQSGLYLQQKHSTRCGGHVGGCKES
jgi:hypothetical protein